MERLTGIIRPPLGRMHSDEERRFIQDYNSDLKALNQLIDVYNLEARPTLKKLKLQAIYVLWKNVGYKYPTTLISRFPEYQNAMHTLLFLNLKKACSQLGLRSLGGLEPDYEASRASPAQPFADFLLNMSPQKVISLLSILSVGSHWNKDEYRGLYQRSDRDYMVFRTLLASHTIEFLGGINSKNFKITKKNDGSRFVLKIDNRLGMPLSVEAHLRKKGLQETFTRIFAERQGTYFIQSWPRIKTTGSLMLTEFCEGKDLETHAGQLATDDERITSALNIYSQMARILSDIKSASCLFPDMKNSNWLVSEDGVVRIADTKSLVFAERTDGIFFWRHRFYAKDLSKNWCRLILTSPMNPPEMASHRRENLSVGKFHSYMLGKNLYQYLTGCPFDYLTDRHHGETYDFTLPVFKSFEGSQLKDLIIQFVKPQSADRMGLAALTKILEAMHVSRQSLIPTSLNYK